MKQPTLFILALWILTACNKDKFKTEPQVKIKSISPSYIARGNVFSIKGSYTDNEGDLDSLFLVYKWFNGNTPVRPPNSINPIDTLRYSFSALAVPDKTKEAEFEIRFEYQTSNLLPQGIIPFTIVPTIRDTTAAFGIILLDKAKNRSNYAESQKVRLQKQ